jgi:hypothetical protein
MKTDNTAYFRASPGTEVITFTPYKNNAGTITGDTYTLYPKTGSLAANFPGQKVSLADPGTDKPVLDSTYLTVWANIVAAARSNHTIFLSASGSFFIR